MKIKSLPAYVMTIIMMAVMASCTKTNPILETVPADADIVAKVNAAKLAEALDIKTDGSELVLPDYLRSASTSAQDLSNMLAAAKSIENQEMFVFVTMAKQQAVVTASLSDPDKIAQLISEKAGQPQETNGYKVWKERNIVIKGNQMWGVVSGNGGDVTDVVAQVLKRAGEKSVAEIAPLASALSGNDLATVVSQGVNVLVKNPTAGQMSVWSISRINTDGSKLTARSNYIYPDGSEAKCETMSEISTPALQYVPSTPLFTAAFGLSADFPWNRVVENVAKQLGSEGMAVQPQLGMLVPYLQAIDGTVLFSIGLPQGMTLEQAAQQFQENPSSFRMILMAHFKEDTARQLVGMATQMAPQIGIKPQDAGNGLMSGDFAGMTLYYGIVDGYLTVANYKPEPTSGSSMAAAFNGKLTGLQADLPSLSFANPSANFGLTATGEVSATEGKFELSLVNSNEKILPALIKLFR